MSRFVVSEAGDGVIRFTAPEGWVDLRPLGDGRAEAWLGTYNGTLPETFGAQVWRLLRDVVPELGLSTLGAEVGPPDLYAEALLVASGFQRDGIRRAWQPTAIGLADVVCYSILAAELIYEVTDAASTRPDDTALDGPSGTGAEGLPGDGATRLADRKRAPRSRRGIRKRRRKPARRARNQADAHRAVG